MLTTAVAVAFSFKHVDIPVLAAVNGWAPHLVLLGKGLGSAILITGEATVFLAIAIARVVRGTISPLSKAVAAACIASICAYAINAAVLKPMFGVLPPGYVLTGWPHAAHLFQGTPDSSFPSGHMALAGAFAGVLMRHYPKAVLPLAAALALAAGLLIAGSFHFVSDVLAGTFEGITAGLLAAEIWLAHERSKAT
jgi:membrane-associated phospholipid phosphatase